MAGEKSEENIEAAGAIKYQFKLSILAKMKKNEEANVCTEPKPKRTKKKNLYKNDLDLDVAKRLVGL